MLSKKIFFVVYIFVIYKANADGTCSYPTSNVPSSVCGEAQNHKTGLDNFDKKSLVESVNANRRHNSHKAQAVKWDDRLAELAQKWANQCSTSKVPDECLPSSGYIYLHQLSYNGPEAEYPHEVVRQLWSQEKIIKPPSNSEYLILDKVGCGRVVATKGNYLLCFFAV